MNRSRTSRRRFLRGLAGGAALAPFIPILDLHAEGEPPPRRLVFFFNSNGTVHESWLPSMNGSELVLSPILAPLEPFKDRLLVVDGLAQRVVIDKGEQVAHYAGMNTSLTGTYAKIIDHSVESLSSLAVGISVDQHVANAVGQSTKLASIECGVAVQDYDPGVAALTYKGPLQPVMPDNRPKSIFDRAFGDFVAPDHTQSAAELERLGDRVSVLDTVQSQLAAIHGTLPRSDRIKLEAHLDSVRALEKSLTTGIGAAATDSCALPPLDEAPQVLVNEDIPAMARAHMDILLMALACDLTRVGTMQFGRAGATYYTPWLGPEFLEDPGYEEGTEGIHELAHDEYNPSSRAKLVKVHTWHAEQVAYFLSGLAAIPEAGGTMLDNTLVVWLNELGTGNHSPENIPWVIAGNVGGFFKTGQLVSFPGEPHNRLLLTLCRAFGLEDATFGDPDYCGAGPLTGVS